MLTSPNVQISNATGVTDWILQGEIALPEVRNWDKRRFVAEASIEDPLSFQISSDKAIQLGKIFVERPGCRMKNLELDQHLQDGLARDMIFGEIEDETET